MFVAAMVLALASPATMQWSIRLEDASTYSFGTTYRAEHESMEEDRSYPISTFDATFRGLTREQLEGNGPIRFDVVRQEGTFHCTGTARGGVADGDFDYSLDPGFAASLSRRGVSGSLSEDVQRTWLLEGADAYGLLDALLPGSGTSVDQLNRAFDHGVDANYVRALGAAGVRVGLDDAVRLADHGVTRRYVEELAQYGFRSLPVEALVRLADHGVTGRYLSGLAQNGYHVTPDQAVSLADHGVTVRYVERLRQDGYANLSVEDLIRLADHGVH